MSATLDKVKNKEFESIKKDVVKFCRTTENVAWDANGKLKDISSKEKGQLTSSCGRKFKAILKNLGIGFEIEKVGDDKIHTYFLLADRKGEIHYLSRLLKAAQDAILSLEIKHHNIDKYLTTAQKQLEAYWPERVKELNWSRSLPVLRDAVYKMRADAKALERQGSEKSRRIAGPILKILSKIKIEHHLYYSINEAYAWSRKRATSEDKTKLTAKANNMIMVNPEYALKSAENIILAAISENTPEDKVPTYLQLTIALLIVSGRRRGEILKTGTFDILPTTKKGHVTFDGQLKLKKRHLFDDAKPYDIPILISPTSFIKAHDVLVEQLNDHQVTYLNSVGEEVTEPVRNGDRYDVEHNDAVSQKYNKALKSNVVSLFEEPEMTPHMMRGIYTEIAYDKFRNDGESRSNFRTRVLGQASGEGDSQLFYEKFELTTKVSKAQVRDQKSNDDKPIYEDAIEFLKSKNEEIAGHIRSPNLIKMHEWTIQQFEKGLKPSQLTQGYVRKYCLLGGKKLNAATIKTYFEKWIHWDEDKVTIFESQLPVAKAKPEKKEIIKPKFDHSKPPVNLGDNVWKVFYSLDGTWHDKVVESDSAFNATKKLFTILNSVPN